MKRFACVIVAGAALLALNSESFAGANANAKVQLHLMSPTTKNVCLRARVACQSIVTNEPGLGTYRFIYVLVTDGNAAAGIAGVQFGIDYGNDGSGLANDGAGLELDSWSLCADLQFITPAPAWPNSGGGNLVTWNSAGNCQVVEPGGPGTGVVAVVGYFYGGSYSAACLNLTVRPVDNAGKTADCSNQEDTISGTPSHYGSACWGAAPGYSPCGLVTPVEQTTWSRIKSGYDE